MPQGTARNRLVKSILFSLLNDSACFRCGELLDEDTLSIDHKEPWENSRNPRELYFSVANIAFSHIRCNIAAARRVKSTIPETVRRREYWATYYAKNRDAIIARRRAARTRA